MINLDEEYKQAVCLTHLTRKYQAPL